MSAKRGEAAKRWQWQRRCPIVIILDVNLPDMSGFEVCRRIKSDPATSQISVLQISASLVSSENKTRALESGADGYLIHPIDGIVLAATVRSLLRLKAAETWRAMPPNSGRRRSTRSPKAWPSSAPITG